MRNQILGALLALSLLPGLAGCHQIPPSHVGIKFNARTGIASKPIEPSVVGVNPFDQERVEDFPTKTINMSFSAKKIDESDQEGDGVPVVTREGVPIEVDTTVAFHVAAANAPKVFDTFGTADMNRIHDLLYVLTQVAMVNVASKMSFSEIVAKEKVRFNEEAQTRLQTAMVEHGFSLDNLYLLDMRRPNDIEGKIQERITAAAGLDTARADQKKIEAEAKTTIIKARQEAEQNRLLGSQGGDTAVRLRKLEIGRAHV